jgi:short subunit fatty acids transporter
MAPLVVMLGGWLYFHFFVRNLSLDINSVNTVVLFLGVALHGTVFRFTEALKDAVGRAWPIVLMSPA